MSIAGSLDTHVLARLIVVDDPAQAAVVVQLLQQHQGKSKSFWIPITVVLELEWVLRSRYKFAKAEVTKAFSSLLMAMELVFESEGAVEQALVNYEEGSADFGECLHLALSQYADALPFWTFDVKASNAVGAKLLDPRAL